MPTPHLVAAVVALSALAIGCSGSSPAPVPLAAAPKSPTLYSTLAAIGSDSSLTDEQALTKMGQVFTQRSKEFHLLEPIRDGVRIAEDQGGWLVEINLRAWESPTDPVSLERSAIAIAQTAKLTVEELAHEMSDLLHAGEMRHLTGVRASLFKRVEQQDGTSDEVLKFRARAAPTNAMKLARWYVWPGAEPPGKPRDEAARKQLESEMWTVEVNEFPNVPMHSQ